MQSVRSLRALAVIIVMLLTTATAWAETVEVTYIGENGIEQTVDAKVLTGGSYMSLTGGWYVCISVTENSRS